MPTSIAVSSTAQTNLAKLAQDQLHPNPGAPWRTAQSRRISAQSVYLVDNYFLKLMRSSRIFQTSLKYKSRQTIPYLLVEIKTFPRFTPNFFMFFPSRVNPTHASVIGHAVYR